MSTSPSAIRLFYVVTDSHPAWRVDLAELFSTELKARGIRTCWSMRRDDCGLWCRVRTNGEDVYLPAATPTIAVIAPLVRRLCEVIGELGLFVKLLVGPRYDFIQVRDDRYTAALFALLAARLRGTRFTYWVSFPFPENDIEKARRAQGCRRLFLQARGHLARWWLYGFILPRADHVFVQSERMQSHIAAYGLPAERMTPVPMGVPTDLITRQSAPDRETVAGRVVYLGTFARSRHLEILLEAFVLVLREFPQATLHLAGRGDTPADRLFLEDLCRQLGVSRQVRFPGFLSKEAAWQLAASAAICVSPIYPSLIFDCGSPTKLYEYMALGRPVVANHHPEQTRAIAESGAGICVEWRAQAFSEAIIHLLKHPANADRMGRMGREWVARHRCYGRLAVKVLKRYHDLLGTS